MQPWRPVDAAQLREKQPALSPDAPAEVLDWSITVDDSQRPQQSTIYEYVRYKIFDPEKAVNLTRVSATRFSSGGSDYKNVDVRARLVLPDGTSKEFGKESLQERDLQKSGGEKTWISRLLGTSGVEVREKFLAIGGIVPGSVVEFQFQTKQDNPGSFYAFLLQRRSVPVRRLRFEQVFAATHLFSASPTLLNVSGLDVKETADAKKTSLIVNAANLPGFEDEPFEGPIYSRVLTYIGKYRSRNERLITNYPFESRDFGPNAGPWVGYATMAYVAEQDVTRPSKILKKLADSVTIGATSDQDRARRIHDYVHDLYLRFTKGTRQSTYRGNGAWPIAEYVAEYDKHPEQLFRPVNFLHLAVALYREAGFETQVLMLPNYDFVFFSQRLTSDVFLPDACARVRVAGVWMYSMPAAGIPLAFGALPWQNRGGVALVAQDSKAEFVDVAEAPASETCVANSGTFDLRADGGLSGKCRRTISGEIAARVRQNMSTENMDGVKRRLGDGLREELKAESASVVSVDGLGDPEKPVSIEYDIHWDNYAEVSKDRIIFRPSVFHGLTQSPFSADTRHNRIVFPYKWTEQDNSTLQLPEGFALESPSTPPSQPGKALDYSISISLLRKTNQLVLKRSFTSNAEAFNASAYSAVKEWFDSMAQSDGHELILVKGPNSEAKSADGHSHPATQ
jgi:hypothetical protein